MVQAAQHAAAKRVVTGRMLQAGKPGPVQKHRLSKPAVLAAALDLQRLDRQPIDGDGARTDRRLDDDALAYKVVARLGCVLDG
jgi:hypothetical protein